MRAVFFGTVTAFALLCCGAAIAQQNVEDEARAQFDAGVALFENGQLAQASVAFARAYELRPSYKILYLVGKCENEQGRFALSLDAYTRYLSEAGDQIDKARQDEVKKEIKRLGALVGTVVVEVATEGATVYVDDVRQGETPLEKPVFVDLGQHAVVVKKGAFELHREVVKVAGGQRVVVKVAHGGAAAEAGPSVEGAAQGTESDDAEETGSKRVWTWVALGVGGAAAIGAGITGGLSLSKTNDLEEQCGGGLCDPSLKDDYDKAAVLGDASTGLFIVAGVGVAAGVVLFFVEPKWNKSEDAVEVAPVAAPTAEGGVFALVGRF
jgi:tetratricopeptide (TPR) repeat protein